MEPFEAVKPPEDFPPEQCQVIRPGMILLREYLTPETQIAIIRRCRVLGMSPVGFYVHEHPGGPKMKLRMMCLGKDWNPLTRQYQLVRSRD